VTPFDGPGVYGSFTVADNGSGALAVTGTAGAAVATDDHAIHFDLTKLAAVTIYASDIKTAAGQQQVVIVGNFVGLTAYPNTDTVYFPACTANVTPFVGPGVYGGFTVGDNGSGSLIVTGTTGAAVATDDHTINFDLTKLAAVTIYGSDLKTAAARQQLVTVPNLVALNSYPTDTVYIPAGTFPVTNYYGDGVYGSVTVADNGSDSLVVTGASGAAVATGNTIHFDLTKLAAVTIFQSELAGTYASVLNIDGYVSLDTRETSDTVYFPAATVRVTSYAGVILYGTFSVSDIGSGVFAVTATTGQAIATDPHTIHFRLPSSLSGLVFEDFNNDGQVDFGEKGISGVTITLTGTDFLGNAVNVPPQTTDSDGAYVFLNLLPGCYYLTETQPAGYLQGIDSVGTAGGSISATDQFFIGLDAGVDGLNYNYGERPSAGGSVQHGQTATIGFWNNKNGQALINALPVVTNADGSLTSVANWLAATLPNTFGIQTGSNDLTGKSNAFVAALFQQDFVLKGVKLDAQVLATALSVYVTNSMLDPTRVAAGYGFTVSGDGAGTATVNVGSNGDAFGVANNTALTLMDLLLATDCQAVNGVLYSGNTNKRNHANNVYSAVNQAGDIG
jgi:hypothetical protein